MFIVKPQKEPLGRVSTLIVYFLESVFAMEHSRGNISLVEHWWHLWHSMYYGKLFKMCPHFYFLKLFPHHSFSGHSLICVDPGDTWIRHHLSAQWVHVRLFPDDYKFVLSLKWQWYRDSMQEGRCCQLTYSYIRWHTHLYSPSVCLFCHTYLIVWW